MGAQRARSMRKSRHPILRETDGEGRADPTGFADTTISLSGPRVKYLVRQNKYWYEIAT
jgi:hypothetical protein